MQAYKPNFSRSHPAWVCGLKLLVNRALALNKRHTLRGCVDWNLREAFRFGILAVTPCVGVWIETIRATEYLQRWKVTPCVGVWIETSTLILLHLRMISHTLRGCVDWNFRNKSPSRRLSVTPCVGVWIETPDLLKAADCCQVTPCVGVWIETSYVNSLSAAPLSHPAWVCGLKQAFRPDFSDVGVTPCVGVWIETLISCP